MAVSEATSEPNGAQAAAVMLVGSSIRAIEQESSLVPLQLFFLQWRQQHGWTAAACFETSSCLLEKLQ